MRRHAAALATAAATITIATTITIGGDEPDEPDDVAQHERTTRHERATSVPTHPPRVPEPYSSSQTLDASTTITTPTNGGDEPDAPETLDELTTTPLDELTPPDTNDTIGGDEGDEPDAVDEQLDDTQTPLDDVDASNTSGTSEGDEGELGAQLVDEPWATLADCESGDWIDGGESFVDESARWRWGADDVELPPWGTTIHHGGLQFHPDTWSWVAPDVLDDPPAHAYDATPAQQVAVAIETQRRQGWEAWPVCSRLVELR